MWNVGSKSSVICCFFWYYITGGWHVARLGSSLNVCFCVLIEKRTYFLVVWLSLCVCLSPCSRVYWVCCALGLEMLHYDAALSPGGWQSQQERRGEDKLETRQWVSWRTEQREWAIVGWEEETTTEARGRKMREEGGGQGGEKVVSLTWHNGWIIHELQRHGNTNSSSLGLEYVTHQATANLLQPVVQITHQSLFIELQPGEGCYSTDSCPPQGKPVCPQPCSMVTHSRQMRRGEPVHVTGNRHAEDSPAFTLCFGSAHTLGFWFLSTSLTFWKGGLECVLGNGSLSIKPITWLDMYK